MSTLLKDFTTGAGEIHVDMATNSDGPKNCGRVMFRLFRDGRQVFACPLQDNGDALDRVKDAVELVLKDIQRFAPFILNP